MSRQLALVFALVASTASAQSLGDLAKRTHADREKAKAETAQKADSTDPKPASKKYTDEDLKNLTPMPGAATPEARPAALSDLPAGAALDAVIAEKNVAKKDREYWFNRMNALLTRLDESTIAADAAAKRESEYEAATAATQRSVDGYIYVDRLLRQKYLDAHDETSRLRATVAADKLAVANLEEEARKADVPPGWLRR